MRLKTVNDGPVRVSRHAGVHRHHHAASAVRSDKPRRPRAEEKPERRGERAALSVDAPAERRGKVHRASAVAVNFVEGVDRGLHLTPELAKGRRDFMLKGAQEFFRANPALFHYDLQHEYAGLAQLLPRAAPRLTIAGDPHVFNFGTVRGDDGNPAWGLNDFDQAVVASCEADLERLGASLVLVGKGDQLSGPQLRRVVHAAAEAYAKEIHRLAAGKGDTDPYIKRADAAGPVKHLVELIVDTGRKARVEALGVHGDRFKKDDPTLGRVTPEVRAQVEKALESYAQRLPAGMKVKVPLVVLDVAEKLGSGGSSFGLPRYNVLVERLGGLPVVLELKSCPPQPTGGTPSQLDANSAPRIVSNCAALGGLKNPLTGYTTLNHRSFLVREREPERGAIRVEELKTLEDLKSTGEQAAVVLARAHAASRAAPAIDGWVAGDTKALGRALAKFSLNYAAQSETDWTALKNA